MDKKNRTPGGQSPSAEASYRQIPRLKVVVAGTGRDGTMSMAKLIGDLAQANGEHMVVEHELFANHICNLLTQFKETGYRFYLDVLRDLVTHIPAHGVAGTTYQFALDLFAEIHGPSLKLIQMKRRDKAAFIRSLSKVIHYRPAMAVNMTRDKCKTDHNEYTFRLAAFHYGEMTRPQWDELSLEKRLSWHYDKTHELIEQAKTALPEHITVYTEELGREETIRNIARFINPAWDTVCPPVHLNSLESWKKEREKNEAIRRNMLLPDE